MATIDRLSVLITGDSDSLQRAASAGERAITSLSDNAISAAGSLRILASAADSAGDKLGGVTRSALGAAAAFVTLGATTGTLNVGFISLSGSAISAGAALAGIATAATGLLAVLTTLAAVVGTLTVGLGALAAAFGAVIGTGILAFGEERAEQTKEQIDNIENQIENLKNKRAVHGSLTEVQQEELETLKERKKELSEQTTISGALQAATADLKDELIPIITDFGEPFIELIADGLDALPDFVENIFEAAGSMEEFADTLRFFGERLFETIPDAIGVLADFARESLPALRNFFNFVLDVAPRAFRAMTRVTDRVTPSLLAFGSAFIDLLPDLANVGATILNTVVPAFTDFVGVLDNVLSIGQESDSLTGFIKTLLNNAVTFLQSDEAQSIISDVTSGLTDVIGGAIDGLDTWLNEEGGSEKISSFASNIMGKLATALEGVSEEDVRSVEKQLLGIIGGFFDAVITSLNSDEAGSLGEELGRIAAISLNILGDELGEYANSEAFQSDMEAVIGAVMNTAGEAATEFVKNAPQTAFAASPLGAALVGANAALGDRPFELQTVTPNQDQQNQQQESTTDETRVVVEPSSELNATIQDEAQTRAELVVQQQSDQAQRNSGSSGLSGL